MLASSHSLGIGGSGRGFRTGAFACLQRGLRCQVTLHLLFRNRIVLTEFTLKRPLALAWLSMR